MCSYRIISEANVTRLIENINIKTMKACNVELSSKTKIGNHIASVYKTIKFSDTNKCRIYSHIFDEINRLSTHMTTIVQDTVPSAPPKIGRIVDNLWQEAGGRRQEAAGIRPQAAGSRQQAAGR